MTELFRFSTRARPEQVWAALTSEAVSKRFLFGAGTRSSWQPGAPVTLGDTAAASVSGQVLYARPPERLSFTLSAGEGQPVTFLTWEVSPASPGAVVRLFVDQLDGSGGLEEMEEVWLPVIEGLRAVLDAPTGRMAGEAGASEPSV